MDLVIWKLVISEDYLGFNPINVVIVILHLLLIINGLNFRLIKILLKILKVELLVVQEDRSEILKVIVLMVLSFL